VDVTTNLYPVTLAIADALLAGDDAFTARFGMPVAPGYLDAPEVLPAMRDALAAGAAPEWGSHLIVHRESITVVGFGGYKGAPVNGEVEIGYSVAPEHRRRGHASSAVAQLVARAVARGVRLVSAHTLAEENPSTRILTRAGFAMTEVVPDEELGTVWRWELRVGPPA
jgi:[ribosomal protein S5]-alanine N-acetyltransferase